MSLVALFAGSFDPFHNGHAGVARCLLDGACCDEVWFVVSPRSPFKTERLLLDERARLEIVETATRDNPRTRACDIEFSMPRPSYTARTLERLSALHPEHRFRLVIGSDNLPRFSEWRDHEMILARHPLLVYPRPGAPFPSSVPPGATLIDAPLFSFSSTVIRDLLSRGEDVSRHVPPSVLPLVLHYYSPRF
ncbi:MAG: nicotinate (nicotinamide) nucleotide adenylyltransferase [Odoribacteraceae bacterium]|nr:nicotinate (nicotinamide) nucleotide adenylyltransferase [Odoribacteraceae bacterium]